jgi:hypothetical protein
MMKWGVLEPALFVAVPVAAVDVPVAVPAVPVVFDAPVLEAVARVVFADTDGEVEEAVLIAKQI